MSSSYLGDNLMLATRQTLALVCTVLRFDISELWYEGDDGELHCSYVYAHDQFKDKYPDIITGFYPTHTRDHKRSPVLCSMAQRSVSHYCWNLIDDHNDSFEPSVVAAPVATEVAYHLKLENGANVFVVAFAANSVKETHSKLTFLAGLGNVLYAAAFDLDEEELQSSSSFELDVKGHSVRPRLSSSSENGARQPSPVKKRSTKAPEKSGGEDLNDDFGTAFVHDNPPLSPNPSTAPPKTPSPESDGSRSHASPRNGEQNGQSRLNADIEAEKSSSAEASSLPSHASVQDSSAVEAAKKQEAVASSEAALPSPPATSVDSEASSSAGPVSPPPPTDLHKQSPPPPSGVIKTTPPPSSGVKKAVPETLPPAAGVKYNSLASPPRKTDTKQAAPAPGPTSKVVVPPSDVKPTPPPPSGVTKNNFVRDGDMDISGSNYDPATGRRRKMAAAHTSGAASVETEKDKVTQSPTLLAQPRNNFVRDGDMDISSSNYDPEMGRSRKMAAANSSEASPVKPSEDAKAGATTAALADSKPVEGASSRDVSPSPAKKSGGGKLKYWVPSWEPLDDWAYPVGEIPVKLKVPSNLTMDSFSELRHIGDGSNSNIYLGKYNMRIVIVKMIKENVVDDEVAAHEFDMEHGILARLDHPNIIKIIGAGHVPRRFVAVEYLDGGSLNSVLSANIAKPGFAQKLFRKPTFTYPMLLRRARELADSLDYLHRTFHRGCCLIHRDLKPDNVGFTRDGALKLFDFGLCTLVKTRTNASDQYEMTGNTGSLRYMAPEVALQVPYTEKCDVYSYGIMVWQMARDRVPFAGFNKVDFMKSVVEAGVRPKLDRSWPPAFCNLIVRCWDRDPQKRPSFKAIIAELDSMGAAPARKGASSK